MSEMKSQSVAAYPEQRWFEDFTLGLRFEYGAWEMRREQMLAFAREYDPEPFHMDDEAAKQLGWDGLIASGLQLACIWRRLSKDAFPNAQIVVSPGWDDLRWFLPVYAGDRLMASSEIIEARALSSRPSQGLVRLSNMITRDGEAVSSFIANWFVRRRSSG